jgi:site-specific DNA recombinase
MVTMQEFERVRRILGAKGKPQSKTREFSYTGNIRCGECGCLVTAETKTKLIKSTKELKDFTYYHCTRRKTGYKCRQRPIRIEDLEPQMDELLQRITIHPVFKDWALKILNRANDQEINDRTKVQEALERALADTQRQLDNLTKMRYRELIDDDEFTRERKELQSKLATLKQERDQGEDRAKNWLELTEKTFHFACYARRSFMFGDVRR